MEDRGPEIRRVAVIMLVIPAVAILLRCFVRLRITKAFGIDDYFMIAAMISYTFNTATCIAGVQYGTGRHAANLAPQDASKALMFWWYCYLTYATTMMLSKTSIACFLFRLTPETTHRWIVKITLAVSLVWGIIFFFIALLQCSPVSYFWTRTGDGRCISVDILVIVTYAYSSFAILTDFALTILPIWLVWHLQMDLRTKIALVPILGMAFVASCAVAVRLLYVEDFKQSDFLYDTADIAIWSQMEQGLAIAAGSFATLQPLFRVTMRKLGYGGHSSARSTGQENAASEGEFSGNSSFGGLSARFKQDKPKKPPSVYNLSVFTKLDSTEEVHNIEQRQGT